MSKIEETICTLREISINTNQYSHDVLLKLDHAILSYLESRNSLPAAETNILTIPALNSVHMDNQAKLLSYNKEMEEYNKVKECISRNNDRVFREFNNEKEDNNGAIDICRDIINELKQYQNIETYYDRLSKYKNITKENNNDEIDTEIMEYINKIDNLLSDDEDEDEHNDEHDEYDNEISDENSVNESGQGKNHEGTLSSDETYKIFKRI